MCARRVDCSDDSRLDLAEEIVGHRFTDRALLRQALTHPSCTEQTDPGLYYERLEFLGDAIIGFVIAAEAYRRFPEMDEGQLTKVKIAAVSGGTLKHVAEKLGLSAALFVGESERGTGGRGMASALENTLEALVAAVYIDAGLDTAEQFALRVLGPHIDEHASGMPEHPKSELQEILQATGLHPRYELTACEGPPHDRIFTVDVFVGADALGSGSGRTKKEAEMRAAQTALNTLASSEEA